MLIRKILSFFVIGVMLFLTNFSFVSWYNYNPNNNSVILNPNLWFDEDTENKINAALYERSPITVAKQLLKAAKTISNKLKKWNIDPKLQKYAQEIADHFVEMSKNVSHMTKLWLDDMMNFVRQAWGRLGMTWKEVIKFVNEVIWKK